MKIIDKIIKILINFRYKRKPFMAWCWAIAVHDVFQKERKRQDEQYNDMVKETISDLSNRIMNLERGAYLSDKFQK